MPALLIVNAAAALFMTGLIWMVQLVHYPLFAEVGPASFSRYHASHSRRITPLVLPVMTLELVTSALLVLAPPPGVSGPAVWTGLALAVALWASTALILSPAHGSLSAGFDRERIDHLVAINWLRTAGWTARSALVLSMLAVAA